MSRSRNTQKKERDLMLYQNYKKVMEKYGELAPYLSKGLIYEEAGKPFFISREHTARLLSDMLKDKDFRATLTEEEVQEYFTQMDIA